VDFTATELDAFLEVLPDQVISERLRQAVDGLKPPRPQEHGLA
jgi:hypothetical protein